MGTPAEGDATTALLFDTEDNAATAKGHLDALYYDDRKSHPKSERISQSQFGSGWNQSTKQIVGLMMACTAGVLFGTSFNPPSGSSTIASMERTTPSTMFSLSSPASCSPPGATPCSTSSTSTHRVKRLMLTLTASSPPRSRASRGASPASHGSSPTESSGSPLRFDHHLRAGLHLVAVRHHSLQRDLRTEEPLAAGHRLPHHRAWPHHGRPGPLGLGRLKAGREIAASCLYRPSERLPPPSPPPRTLSKADRGINNNSFDTD